MNEALIAPIVTGLVALLRVVWPNMPARLIVAATPLLGLAIGEAANAVADLEVSPELAAAAGALGTWLHQVGKQWCKKAEAPQVVTVPGECKLIDKVWDNHLPADQQVRETYCVRCGMPLKLKP